MIHQTTIKPTKVVQPKKQIPQATVVEPTSYQQNLSQPVEEKWYSGDAPTTREVYGRIAKIQETDPTKAKIAAYGFSKAQQDDTSPYYAPYLKPTNAAVNEFASYGYDVSNIDDNFFLQNSGLKQYRVYNGTTNTPSSPGSKATKEQNASYALWQIEKANDTTVKAQTEWKALQEELAYYANSPLNYSDNEIIERVYGDDFAKKYPTLYAMDESLRPGSGQAILELNTGIDYSKDNCYTVIWRARNNGGTGSMEADSAMSVNGQGNQWKANREIEEKRATNPYAAGMTMEDEGAYYGVYEFDQNTIDDIKANTNPYDATAIKMRDNVIAAFKKTEALKEDVDNMYAQIDDLLTIYSDPDDIIDIIQSNSAYNGLFKLDESIADGTTPIKTTSAINYSWNDVENYIKDKCAEKDAEPTALDFTNDLFQRVSNTFDWSFNTKPAKGEITPTAVNEEAEESRITPPAVNPVGVETATPAPAEVTPTAVNVAKETATATNTPAPAPTVTAAPANVEVREEQPVATNVEAAAEVGTTSAFDESTPAPFYSAADIAIEKEARKAITAIEPIVNEVGTESEKIAVQTGKTSDFNRDVQQITSIASSVKNTANALKGAIYDRINTSYIGDAQTILNFDNVQSRLDANREYRDVLQQEHDELQSRVVQIDNSIDLSPSEINNLSNVALENGWGDVVEILSDPENAGTDAYDTALTYIYKNVKEDENGEHPRFVDIDEVRPEAEAMWQMIQGGIEQTTDNPLTEEESERYNVIGQKIEELNGKIAEDEQYLNDHDGDYKSAQQNKVALQQSLDALGVDSMFLPKIDFVVSASANAPNVNRYQYAIADMQVDYYGMSPYEAYVWSENTAEQDLAAAEMLRGTIEELQNNGVGLGDNGYANAMATVEALEREGRGAGYTALDGSTGFASNVKKGKKIAAESTGFARLLSYAGGDLPQEGTWDYQEFQKEVFNACGVSDEDEFFVKNWHKILWNISPKEVDRYMSLLDTDGQEAADNYLKFIYDPNYGELYARSAYATQQAFHDYASQDLLHAGLAWGMSVVNKPISELTYLGGRIAGIDNPLDPAYMYLSYNQEFRSGINNVVNETLGKDNFVSNLINRGVNVIGGLADIGVGTALVGSGNIATAAYLALGNAEQKHHSVWIDTGDINKADKMAAVTFVADVISHTVILKGLHNVLATDPSAAASKLTQFFNLTLNNMGAAAGSTFATELATETLEKILLKEDSAWGKIYQQYIDMDYPETIAEEMANNQLWNNVCDRTVDSAINAAIRTTITYGGKVLAPKVENALTRIKNRIAPSRGEDISVDELLFDPATGKYYAKCPYDVKWSGKYEDRPGSVRWMNPEGTPVYIKDSVTGRDHVIYGYTYTGDNIFLIDSEGVEIPLDAVDLDWLNRDVPVEYSHLAEAPKSLLWNIYDDWQAKADIFAPKNETSAPSEPAAEETPGGIVPVQKQETATVNSNAPRLSTGIGVQSADLAMAQSDSMLLMNTYDASPTSTSVVVASILGGSNEAQAAAQSFVGNVTNGNPQLASNAMNGLLYAGADKNDLIYASLTNGVGAEALRACVEKIANGEQLTPSDVNLIATGLAADRKAHPRLFERGFQAAVRDSMVANRMLAVARENGADKVVEKGNKAVGKAKNNLKGAKKNAKKATKALSAAGENMVRAEQEYDPVARPESATERQNTMEQTVSATAQLGQAVQTLQAAQANVQQAREEANNANAEALAQARVQAEAETDQLIQQNQETAYNNAVSRIPPHPNGTFKGEDGQARSIEVYDTDNKPVRLTGVYDYKMARDGDFIVFTTEDGHLVVEGGEQPGSVDISTLEGDDKQAVWKAINKIETMTNRSRQRAAIHPEAYFPKSFTVDINGQAVEMIGLAGKEIVDDWESAVLMDIKGNLYSMEDEAFPEDFPQNAIVQDSFDAVANTLPVIENVPRIQNEVNVNGRESETQSGPSGLTVQRAVGAGNNARKLAPESGSDVGLGDNGNAEHGTEEGAFGRGEEGQTEYNGQTVGGGDERLRDIITERSLFTAKSEDESANDPYLESTEDYGRFSSSLADAKANSSHGAYVDNQSPEELEEMGAITLLSPDGMAGVAIGTKGEKAGNICGVFNNSRGTVKHTMPYLMTNAIKKGGNKLDCYDGFLSRSYEQFGFVPVAKVKFNPKFAPDDWNYERDGEPDVIVWMHRGDSAETVALRYAFTEAKGGYHRYTDEEMASLPYFDDYFAALKYRDNLMLTKDRGEEIVSTHTCSIENGISNLKEGGMLGGSVAVSKAGANGGAYDYGKEGATGRHVIFLYGEKSIDPAVPGNVAYGEDAYSPTFASAHLGHDSNGFFNTETGERLTRDEAVKLMFDGVKEAQGALRKYKTLDEMKADVGRLVAKGADAYTKFRDGLMITDDAATELFHTLPEDEQQRLTEEGDADGWTGDEHLQNILADNLNTIYYEGMPVKEMQDALKGIGLTVSEEAAAAYKEQLDRAVGQLTTMFEVKMQRFTGNEEIIGAVVPDDHHELTNELIGLLDQNGIPYFESSEQDEPTKVAELAKALREASKTPIDKNGEPVITPNNVNEEKTGLEKIMSSYGLSASDHEGIPQMSDLTDSGGNRFGYTFMDRNGRNVIGLDSTRDNDETHQALTDAGFIYNPKSGEWVQGNASQSGGIHYMASSRRPKTPTERQAEKVASKVQSPQQIAKQLVEKLGFGDYLGSNNLGSRTATSRGYWDDHARLLAVKDNEIGNYMVTTHEIGHGIAHELGMRATDRMIESFVREDEQLASEYTPDKLRGEAFAEFFRRYLEDDDHARAFAGDDYVDEFERQLIRHPAMYKAVNEAKSALRQWINGGEDVRAQAKIRHEMNPGAIKFKKQVKRMINDVIDNTSVAQDVDDYTQSGGTLRRQALFANHSQKRAIANLTDSLTDANGTIIGEGFGARLSELDGFHGTETEVHALEEYRLLQHSFQRDEQNKTVFGEDITPEERNKRIKNLEEQYPWIKDANKIWSEFHHDFMQAWMVDTGYWSQDFLDHLEKMYPNYAPTFRIRGNNEDAGGNYFTGFGRNAKRFSLHEATGGSEDIYSPLYSYIGMVDQITSMVATNQIAQEFDRLYQENEGMGIFGRQIPRESTTRVGSEPEELNTRQARLYELLEGEIEDDLMQEVLDIVQSQPGVDQRQNRNSGQNILSVQRADGTNVQYEIKDPQLYKLLTGVQASSGIRVLEVIGRLTRTMSMLTTGSNPLFSVRNAMRDYQNSVNYGTWASNYLSGARRWLSSLIDVARGSDLYKQYEALGGGGWTYIQQGSPETMRSIQSQMFGDDKFKALLNEPSLGKTAKWLGKTLWHTITAEKLNEWIEQASRFAEFKYGKHDLGTAEGRQEAFQAAQDVTVDFSRKGVGEAAFVLKRVVPFFSASAQGVYRTARQGTKAERGRVKQRAIKTIVNTALASALANGLILLFGDKYDKEEYAMLSDGVKANHFILPNPFGDTPFIRIPIGQDPLMYAVNGMVSNAMWNGSIDEWAISLAAITDVILDNLNPIGSGTIAQPFIDVSHNRTWYGSSIVRKSQEDWTDRGGQYNEDTPDVFKWFGRLLNVSPEVVEYLASQYTGFIGQLGIPALTINDDGSLGGFDAIMRSITKKFTADPASSNDVTKNFYNMKEDFETITGEAKADRPQGLLLRSLSQEEVDQAYEEAAAMQKKGGIIYDTTETINNAYKEIDRINANDSMTDDEKYEATRKVKIEMLKQVEAANEQMEAYMKKYVRGETLTDRVFGAIRKRFEEGKTVHIKTDVELMPSTFQNDMDAPYMQRSMSVYNGDQEGSESFGYHKSAALPHPSYSFTKDDVEYEIPEDERGTYDKIYRDSYQNYVMGIAYGKNGKILKGSEKAKQWDTLTDKEQYEILKNAAEYANGVMKDTYISRNPSR